MNLLYVFCVFQYGRFGKTFLIASWLVPVSLGQTCFVLIWSGPITSQENIYPELDMSQTVNTETI